MLVSIGLLGISLNLDALCVGLTYGIRGIRIPWVSKLILLVLSCGFSFLAVFCGRWLMLYFPPAAARWIGASILLFMGAVTILKALFSSDRGDEKPRLREFGFSVKHVSITIRIMKKPECCDMDDSCAIEPKEALYLGVALSVDALAAGIAVSMNGAFHFILPFVIALFQFVFISIGRFMGEHFEKRISISSKAVNVVAGAMLMLVALLRVWF